VRAREAEARVVEMVGAAAVEATAAAAAERVAMAERVERAEARVEVERVEAVTVRGTVKRRAPLLG
jgi:hypothetical protein